MLDTRYSMLVSRCLVSIFTLILRIVIPAKAGIYNSQSEIQNPKSSRCLHRQNYLIFGRLLDGNDREYQIQHPLQKPQQNFFHT